MQYKEKEKIKRLLEKKLEIKLEAKEDSENGNEFFYKDFKGLLFSFEFNRTLFTIYTKKDLPTVFYYNDKDLEQAKNYIKKLTSKNISDNIGLLN